MGIRRYKNHNNQEKQHEVFYKFTINALTFFHKMIFFLKERCFQCQETEFMKTKWKEGNSHNIPTGRLILEFILLWGHQAPKNPCSSREKIFLTLYNDLCNMSLLGKINRISRESLSYSHIQLYFNESMCWLRNKYLEKSE